MPPLTSLPTRLTSAHMAHLISDQISDLYLRANYQIQNAECLALKGQSPNTWLDCDTQGCVRGILGEKHWWSVRTCEMGHGIRLREGWGQPRLLPPDPRAITLPTGPWERGGGGLSGESSQVDSFRMDPLICWPWSCSKAQLQGRQDQLWLCQ